MKEFEEQYEKLWWHGKQMARSEEGKALQGLNSSRVYTQI
jgi:hypothetical protein